MRRLGFKSPDWRVILWFIGLVVLVVLAGKMCGG
jgi:hypothetical protein